MEKKKIKSWTHWINDPSRSWVPKILYPIWFFEWLLQMADSCLKEFGIVKVFESISKLAVLAAVLSYLCGADERKQERIQSAWNSIYLATGQGGDGGRKHALQYLNENGALLSNLNLDNAVLNNIQLQGSELRESTFSHANLRRADLSNSDLLKAEFFDASLYSAKFRHSDLRVANFKDSVLTEVDFSNAKLNRANFQNADARGAIFDLCDLSGANFEGSNIEGATFSNAIVTNLIPEDIQSLALEKGAICR